MSIVMRSLCSLTPTSHLHIDGPALLVAPVSMCSMRPRVFPPHAAAMGRMRMDACRRASCT